MRAQESLASEPHVARPFNVKAHQIHVSSRARQAQGQAQNARGEESLAVMPHVARPFNVFQCHLKFAPDETAFPKIAIGVYVTTFIRSGRNNLLNIS